MDDETPIENKMISRSIEGAQVKVESFHFDMRKHLVEYDDVINSHRISFMSKETLCWMVLSCGQRYSE